MELIKSWVWNPMQNKFFGGNKKDKAQANQYYCSNKDNCSLFKENQCKLLNLKGFSNEGCIYGENRTLKGFTPMANAFSDWISKMEKYDCGKDIKSNGKGIFEIGDYIYLNFSYIDLFKFKNGFKFNMIKKEEFTLELIVELINFKPLTIFDCREIKDYQKKEVPLFVENLKLKFKDLFEQLPQDTKEKYIISNIGRKALIHTINKNIEFNIEDKKYFWDGERISCKNYQSFLFDFKGETELIIYPNKDETLEIKSEYWVNENTRYID